MNSGCEDCGHWQVVLAQYRLDSRLGLNGRFCGGCLPARITEKLGEDPYAPIGRSLFDYED